MFVNCLRRVWGSARVGDPVLSLTPRVVWAQVCEFRLTVIKIETGLYQRARSGLGTGLVSRVGLLVS